MSAVIAEFIRNIPQVSLEAYFKFRPSGLSKAVNWNKPPKNITKPLLVAVNELNAEDLAHIQNDAERVNTMTDEIGQAALLSVISNERLSEYQKRHNAHDRAVFVFLQDQDAFRRAEEIWYADYYRKGRMWSGFVGPKDTPVSREPAALASFKQKIVEYFHIVGKVKIELFDRAKTYKDDQELQIVYVMVYREGLPESYTALENDDLVPKTFRPVIEMALTYEPVSGQIEVVADNRECRSEVAKIFAGTLLQTEIDAETIPLKEYDISKLLRPYEFPTDPEDGITAVKVTMLQLKPYDNGNKVTLEVSAKEARSIYDVSQEWFDAHDPLRRGFRLAQVKFAIYFAPTEENARGKVMPVKISWPNSCDLKSKTEKERLIGDKYLRRWGLLKEV